MKNDKKSSPCLITAHGRFPNLKSYQMSEIVYDAATVFCNRFIDRRSRTQTPIFKNDQDRNRGIALSKPCSPVSSLLR
jgi:hypothetical protein